MDIIFPLPVPSFPLFKHQRSTCCPWPGEASDRPGGIQGRESRTRKGSFKAPPAAPPKNQAVLGDPAWGNSTRQRLGNSFCFNSCDIWPTNNLLQTIYSALDSFFLCLNIYIGFYFLSIGTCSKNAKASRQINPGVTWTIIYSWRMLHTVRPGGAQL